MVRETEKTINQKQLTQIETRRGLKEKVDKEITDGDEGGEGERGKRGGAEGRGGGGGWETDTCHGAI